MVFASDHDYGATAERQAAEGQTETLSREGCLREAMEGGGKGQYRALFQWWNKVSRSFSVLF